LSHVNMTLCHVAETIWCGSGSAMCHYWMGKKSQCSLCICYFVSIWSQFF